MEYDELDVRANRLLFRGKMPHPGHPLGPCMVEYYKTPARIVYELIARVGFGPADVFVDLGCGLGQVVLLVHWLTGVRARGIDIEPAYCEYARRCAAAKGFNGTHFLVADVREADLSGGTVFYLFTPVTGDILRTVLDRLRRQAEQRKIRVLSYGPCSRVIEHESWLQEICPADSSDYVLRVFGSR